MAPYSTVIPWCPNGGLVMITIVDVTSVKPGSMTLPRLAIIGSLGWLAKLGVDFFLHAGVFARLYAGDDSPFLLGAAEAFARIPFGYLCFALYAALLVWLMNRMRISGAWRGGRFGLTLGAFVWSATVLGLYSITTARPALLLAWFVGEVIQMGVAGMVIGSGLAGRSLWKLGGIVLGIVVVLILATVILQVTGLSPPMSLASQS